MTWTKLSDDFSDDCDQLSSDAFRLHVEGLIRSNRKLLDLRLDKTQMPRWVWNVGLAEIALKELLAAGWWSDDGDHYLIRHHACYQRTREQVLKQQETNRANRAKGKARPVREQAAGIHPETESVDDSSDEPSDESTDERDWTGQDRKNAFKGTQNSNGNGSGATHCRYCDTELRPSMRSQQLRGYCNRPACIAEATAEATG
jgi:hypothetical protein